MKKLFLFYLLVLVFAACNNDDVSDGMKNEMDTGIRQYLVDESFVDASVKVEEYKKVDISLHDIKEYARLNDSLIIYLKRYEELEDHLSEERNMSEYAPAVMRGGNVLKCSEDEYLLEEYGGMISSLKDRIAKIENLYTSKNYIAEAVLNQYHDGKCTPVWFFFNDEVEIIVAYFFSHESYICK